MKKLPSIQELSLEIFNSVQGDQGFAHISDGLDAIKSYKRFFHIIRCSHKHSKIALKKIETFLKKYNEMEEHEKSN